MKQTQNQKDGDQQANNSENAFREGSFDHHIKLNENTDPKNPSNDDDRITNTQEQNVVDEDVEDQSAASNADVKKASENLKDDGQPETNTPVNDPGKSEDKLPKL